MSVRHRCWGHPSSTEGYPCLPDLSLAAIPLGLQKHPPNDGSARQALVSWISVDLSVKVSRTVSDPGSCLSNLSSSSALRRHRISAPGDGKPVETRTKSQTRKQPAWKSREERTHFPGSPHQHHPSLAATSCPMPSRIYTDWISLVLRQRSQAQTAEASVVSSP